MLRAINKMNHYPAIITVLFFSCGTDNISKTEINNNHVTGQDSLFDPSEPEILDKSYKSNLLIAMKNLHENEFELKTEDIDPVNNDEINSELVFGNLFSPKSKHLLMRRYTDLECIIDVFIKENDTLKHLLTHTQDDLTFIGDTIFDVNGDNLKDFVVQWYPSSGCCRRNIQTVYLFQTTEDFSEQFEFVNATFSPQEGIIRGVQYGHPHETGLYKFKWNGAEIDSIEFIYHDLKNKKGYIRTKKSTFGNENLEGELLKTLPKEYLNIQEIDWFNSESSDN